MSFSSNVPEPTFGPNGVQVPAETDILTGVQGDLNAAFGGGLDFTNLETAEGQIASTATAIIGDKNNQFLWFCSQVDPATAEGRMQDGIARIYFIDRDPAIATVVACNCMGAVGTNIPRGAQALATDGNVYYAIDGGTIPSSGIISLQFACQKTGPIVCPASALNQIYRAVPGWDSIFNPSDGVVGNDVESQADFETRRAQSVALNSRGSIQAVLGQLLSVPNVIDAYVTDNRTSANITVGGVTLVPHSLYACVSGGLDADVAQAIYTKCSIGCDFNGSTTVTVYDTTYAAPQPAEVISFQRPTSVATKITVTITNSIQVPSGVIPLVQQTVLEAFAGLDKGPRARIGGTVYASRFYAGVASLGAWAQIVSIKVGTTAPASVDSFTVNINQIPTLAASDITVTLV